jgi:HEPN domain-containing protein
MSGLEEDIQAWLRYAEADMAAAEGLHRLHLDPNALFHLQQAAEKTLKALLLKQTGAAPPRIHSLRALAERCELSPTVAQTLLLEKLSNYYVESRYPGEWEVAPPEVIGEEAETLMFTAKEFMQWLRSQI